jgi:hypothetical protein
MKKSLGKATELVLGLKTIFYSPSYTARREFISHKEAQKSSTNALTSGFEGHIWRPSRTWRQLRPQAKA